MVGGDDDDDDDDKEVVEIILCMGIGECPQSTLPLPNHHHRRTA
jgi:hypothetical protein